MGHDYKEKPDGFEPIMIAQKHGTINPFLAFGASPTSYINDYGDAHDEMVMATQSRRTSAETK